MNKSKESRWLGAIVGTVALAACCALSVFSKENPRNPSRTAWNAPASAAAKTNPVSADTSSVAHGKTIYMNKCLACHGRAGQGDGRNASRLKVQPGDLSNPRMWQQSDGELFWKISQGKTPMPSYQKQLSEKERWMVVNYIRTLAPKPPGPAAPATIVPQSRVAPSSGH